MQFPNEQFNTQKDRFFRSRGSSSMFLYIACSNCDEPSLVYQKDGPGSLQRTYADRIVWPPALVERLRDVTSETIKDAGSIACGKCEATIGTPMVYRPEDRPAYSIIPGSIHAYRGPEQAVRAELRNQSDNTQDTTTS